MHLHFFLALLRVGTRPTRIHPAATIKQQANHVAPPDLAPGQGGRREAVPAFRSQSGRYRSVSPFLFSLGLQVGGGGSVNTRPSRLRERTVELASHTQNGEAEGQEVEHDLDR